MRIENPTPATEHSPASSPRELGGTALGGNLLSPELQEKADKTATAMAEMYDVPAEDFSIFYTTAEDGTDRYTVAYTAATGLDLGNPRREYDKKREWENIFGKRQDRKFTVKVDGERIDTRLGMTDEVYDALVVGAKARGIDPLPDSPQLVKQHGEDRQPMTWLVGTPGRKIGYVDKDGKIVHGHAGPYHKGVRGFGFRPAAVIKTIGIEEGSPAAEHSPVAGSQELGAAALNADAGQSELLLTHEQQEKVSAAKVALAEKFGVPAETFVTLRVPTKNSKHNLTVAYAAPDGMRCNPKRPFSEKRNWFSWDTIFGIGSKKDFTVRVNGQKLDSRLGMTYPAYAALVDTLHARGKSLSDEKFSICGTWLTGQGARTSANTTFAPVGVVRGDKAVRTQSQSSGHNYSHTFRPSVIIE